MRPWSFGHEVRTVRTDYPGTVNRPTEQVLGANMTDFTLSGKWLDKWNTPGYAVEQWKSFERMVNQGMMVRISYRSVWVDGIIKQPTYDYHHEAKIFYSFTVSPHNREPGQPLRSSPRTVLNSKQLLEEVVDIRDEIADLHADAPRFFVAGTLWNDVDAIIAEWDSTLETLENIIAQRIVLPELEPGTALRRIAAMFRLVRSNSEDMATLLESVRSDTDLTYAGAIQILSFDVWAKGILWQSKRLLVNAERASRELLSRADPPSIALYSPSENEHLYKISNDFYGHPGNWKRIAARNNLGASMTLTGDELLIIPEAVARK